MTINKIDVLFNKLDDLQCYLLGYIINNVAIIQCDNNQIEYTLNDYFLEINFNSYSLKDKEIVLRLLNNLIDDKWKYSNNKIIIKSTKLCNNYFNLLNINTQLTINNKENIYNFPYSLLLDNLNSNYWSFVRGFFEKNGKIIYNKNIPKCIISFYNYSFMHDFLHKLNIPYSKQINLFEKENDLTIELISTNCIDFLGLIYNKNRLKIYNDEMYNKYQTIINWKFIIQNSLQSYYDYIDINNDLSKLDICKVYKSSHNAIIPSKSKESDVGYDLTIISKYKKLSNITTLYDTGIKLEVDYGYYIEIVPRSSLSKSGYILSNSIGIIEKSYTGNLLVALTKIDNSMSDLALPFKCCQLIFKPQISLNLLEIKNINNISNTLRNNGGFGSSN